jgi:hypothetical protein
LTVPSADPVAKREPVGSEVEIVMGASCARATERINVKSSTVWKRSASDRWATSNVPAVEAFSGDTEMVVIDDVSCGVDDACMQG